MRILITGSSGFLGSHIAEKLSKAGHEVRALVRPSSDRSFLDTLPNLTFVEGSVENRAAVRAAVFKDGGVDAIIHSAALVKARHEAEFELVNVHGTGYLLEAAQELEANKPGTLKRYVQISSLEASGPSLDGLPVSASQKSPITSYGRSKLAADELCLSFSNKLKVVIVRPAAIYGPRDVEILQAFLAAKKRQYPVIGDGSMKGCYIYGPDCAELCIKALFADVESGSMYFADDGEPRTMKEAMGEILFKALGVKPLFKVGIPFGLMKLVSRGVKVYGNITNKAVMLTPEKVNMLSHHWVCESSKTKRDLDWEPSVQLEEGFKLTAKWYQEKDWL